MIYERMNEIITLSDVKKSYTDSNHEVTNVLHVEEMRIHEGEQFSLTGPSGCGKSTLLHIIGGVLEASSGEVIVHGTHLEKLPMQQKDAFRANNIGYVFQDFHLIPSLTATENVQLALNKPSVASLKSIGEWFHRVGLSGKQTAYPHELSRGQQQRVALIRALIHQPKLLLADEPTGSLDVKTASDIMELLLHVCIEQQITLLCVTHDMALASRFPHTIEMQQFNRTMQQGVYE